MSTVRILTFSTLYPNRQEPEHGIFVETRLRQLLASGQVAAQVVAPVPWVPSPARLFGRYGRFAAVPGEEVRAGITVMHPRYPVLPKVGMHLAPLLLYGALAPVLRRIIWLGNDFDLIDAHYLYPDGVAAVMLGQRLGKPVVLTARGSDVNLIPRYRMPRRMILWAARNAAAVVTVCQALKDELVRIGVAAEKIHVLRNGVNPEVFTPIERTTAKSRLGVSAPLLVSAGHLVPSKGHDRVIRALAHLPDVALAVVGEGPARTALRELVRSLGYGDRVHFLGTVAHARMPEVYSAADALVLASDREGWPNVLLEAMACGTPVVANAVGGVPEVVASPAAGTLLRERNPQAIAEAVRSLLAAPPDPAETRAYAKGFGWSETTQGLLDLFRTVVHRDQTAGAAERAASTVVAGKGDRALADRRHGPV